MLSSGMISLVSKPATERVTKMPVQTMILRDNDPLVIGWGYWHLECLHRLAAHQTLGVAVDATYDEIMEASEAQDEVISFFPSRFTYTVGATYVDPSDGEVFTIEPGDVFCCCR
jgi:hypothetical protein